MAPLADLEPRCSGENIVTVQEIAIALRESARAGHASLRMPLEDCSLTLYPRPSRSHNREPIFGAEEYVRQIGAFDTPSYQDILIDCA